MSGCIEPFILYLVLFLPGAVPYGPPPDPTVFSVERELARIILYNIPSFALIWYLLLQKKSLKGWGIGLPGKKDIFAALCAFPGLLLIGLTISIVSPFFTEIPAGAAPGSPVRLPGWIVLFFSCISTGYLEESFFRFYLLARLHDLGIKTGKLVCLSVLLFALCHIYEGPWGMLNAMLAAVLLSFLFLHFKSLHGVALAHGLYNAFVYALGA
jgi:membrane protease YdiL (CAAX protease family)